MRVSEYYKLNKSQIELDFVDVPLDGDIRLFADPYALSIETDPWFAACHNILVDYFQSLLEAIIDAPVATAMRMLENLSEPNDTRLGYSSGSPSGRGIGQGQAEDLYARFATSRAVKTGQVRDVSDCELMIPGISHDKISDLTINVLRIPLTEYTQSQCRLHKIPMQRIPIGPYWHPQQNRWVNQFGELPVFGEGRLLLIPKSLVRYSLTVDHATYYRHFVLNYLQQEHLDSNTSLVRTLKNGKRVVRKNALEAEYPLTKNFLFEFSEQHPDVLAKYKASLPNDSHALKDADLEYARRDPVAPDYKALAAKLRAIPTGNASANQFHDTVIGILQSTLYPRLRNPQKEHEVNAGQKRIDIVFNNSRESGFFYDLSALHHIKCPYIFFECKNYSSDPKNPEFDQLAGRLQKHRGMFGVMVVRQIEDKAEAIKRCKHYLHESKYIIVIDDADLIAFLDALEAHKPGEIDLLLSKKMQDLVS